MNSEKTNKVEAETAPAEKVVNDNKVVFGPLGRYAVVAVIMVSIIVTSAIMLNKQLGNIDEQLAVIENEVAEKNAATLSSTVTAEASETASEIQSTETAVENEISVVEETAVEEAAVTDKAAEVQTAAAPVAETVEATEKSVKETAPLAAVSTEQHGVSDEASIEPANNAITSDNQLAQQKWAELDQQRQARIETYKVEQKQHMSEMFARIKALESQRLEEYKVSQDKQVERLREQIEKQEQMIEALILRNKEWVDMRAASMQRSQSHREKMLDRI